MAIFDSEKRPRGLRVPSLTAMKAGTAASVSQFSFHRTKSNEQQQQRTPEEEVAPPVPTIGLPAPAPPPPTKELPTPPQAGQPPTKELPPRPRITSKVPPRRAVGSINNNNAPRPSETSPISSQGIRQATSPIVSSSPKHDQPLPATPSLGLRQQNPTITTPTSPQPEQEAESPATIKAPQGVRHTEPSALTPTSPQLSKSLPTPAPEPVPVPVQQVQSSLPPTPPVGPQSTESPESPVPVRPAQSLPVQQPPPTQKLPPTPPPVTLSPPPTEDENEALTPLEDFIPTPDGASTPLEQMSSNEQAPPGLNSQLDIEPVAAPLNKVHFACFQEHRNMPVAQNVWCPVPCMTCHKHDQEIRHRCVFCSLRICEGCHRALQKTRNRSLADLMSTLGQ